MSGVILLTFIYITLVFGKFQSILPQLNIFIPTTICVKASFKTKQSPEINVNVRLSSTSLIQI